MSSYETINTLWDYAERGGVVICDTALGLYDVNGVNNSIVPPFGTEEKLGIRERESMWIPDTKLPATLWERMGPLGAPPGASIAHIEEIYLSPIMHLTTPIEVDIRPRIFLTPLTVSESVEVIGTCEGLPVAAVVQRGKGLVYYFGTNLGACIHEGETGALQAVQAILAKHAPPVVSGARLRPRLMRGEQASILVILNEAADPLMETIRLPEGYRQAKDLYSGATMPITERTIQARVDAQDVQVIHLI